ncbi:hypothetical protein FGO68_gene16347 [Halteria grandinella]|uniref:Uncharacterized protein n=1 Tax=Halteria grandinella TaxID=5974 RepID=A0A8J8T191_HALGN|nr:hypothetical protein FGO68_gene16347 [Halteria grandinella]
MMDAPNFKLFSCQMNMLQFLGKFVNLNISVLLMIQMPQIWIRSTPLVCQMKTHSISVLGLMIIGFNYNIASFLALSTHSL